MRNLIRKVEPDVCVEIGVFGGKSLINTALALKENGNGMVYGIDPWRTEVCLEGNAPNEDPEFWHSIDLDAVHYDCMRAIWQHELDDYAVVIRAKSLNAHHLFPDGSIDILYIDGGHSEDAARDDVVCYGPSVRDDGYIWIDDTNYDSLKLAISILEKQCTLLKDFGHCRLYQKAL